jgi:hypothetical protein
MLLAYTNLYHADLQHHIFYLTLNNRLGLSPPSEKDAKVGRVLDLGTGTGIWAMDYGDEHPEAQVWLLQLMHWTYGILTSP